MFVDLRDHNADLRDKKYGKYSGEHEECHDYR